MIDTHCHILPNLDDGSKSLQESLAMFDSAQKDGIEAIIATPHINPGRFDNHIDKIRKSTELLSEYISQTGHSFPLKFAAEIRLCPELFNWIECGVVPWLSYDGSKYHLLLELSTVHYPHGAFAICQRLIEQNIIPVIAHPERYRYWQNNPLDMLKFEKLGCEFQITAGSLLGRFREDAKQFALQMVRENKVSWVASDAHNLTSRPVRLSDAYECVTEISGTRRANTLFIDRPAEIYSCCPGFIPTKVDVTHTTQEVVTSEI